jgi:hypothetical protein
MFNLPSLNTLIIRKITRKRLFADGNISSAFEGFEREHKCNAYCTYYGLAKFRPHTAGPRMLKVAQGYARDLEAETVDMEMETGEMTRGGKILKHTKRA